MPVSTRGDSTPATRPASCPPHLVAQSVTPSGTPSVTLKTATVTTLLWAGGTCRSGDPSSAGWLAACKLVAQDLVRGIEKLRDLRARDRRARRRRVPPARPAHAPGRD